jgi:hypothetical protein
MNWKGCRRERTCCVSFSRPILSWKDWSNVRPLECSLLCRGVIDHITSQSKSLCSLTDGRSFRLSWCRALPGTRGQNLLRTKQWHSRPWRLPLTWTELCCFQTWSSSKHACLTERILRELSKWNIIHCDAYIRAYSTCKASVKPRFVQQIVAYDWPPLNSSPLNTLCSLLRTLLSHDFD